jgi:aspartokinase-like uncharacterized kinase
MEGIAWKSYDGRRLYIHEMTHEHISSLYYFMRYIHNSPEESVITEINRVINEKYNGIILPYRPPSDVIGEAEKLHQQGLLKYDKANHKFDIIDDGEWIGEIILKPEQEVDETTGMFKVDRLMAYKKKREELLIKMLVSHDYLHHLWEIAGDTLELDNKNQSEEEV